MNSKKFKSRLKNLSKHSRGERSSAIKVDWFQMPSDLNFEDIKRLRKFLKMTQSQFAALLGVSLQTIKMWETDRRHPEATARKLMEFVLNYPELAPLLTQKRYQNKQLINILKKLVGNLESKTVDI